MSQNLIEKLQEIWDTARQDPTIRRGRRHWRKIQKTDGYKIAAATLSDVGHALGKAGRYLLNKGKIYGLVVLNLLYPAPLSGNQPSATQGRGNNGENSTTTRKEYRLSDIQARLQAAYSAEELENMCTKLIGTDSIYTRLCAERSQQMGDEILRVAKEVQTQIGNNRGKIRSQVLKQRWGRDVPVGLHCLRSALEVTAEAAENTNSPEFVDMFVSKIRDYNPNGYYGLHDVFYKHRNYKKTTRQHNLLQIIQEETKDNPQDILLIAHKSSGNHTGSGYHMVLCYNDTIVSFNNEKIEDKDVYFSKVSKQGELINISRTVREDGKDEIIRQIVKQIKSDIKAGNPETIQTLLAMYMGDKDIPLQDRMLAGAAVQKIMPPVIAIDPLDNFKHLRQVRAKLTARQTTADYADARTTEKESAVRPAKGSKQTLVAQNRRARPAKDIVRS